MALPRSIIGRNNGENDTRGHWALDDITFEVLPGSVLGIIGPNGAGKTTTLKLLSRVTRPTKGNIKICGRISALIELGAGFHPDLTGRENIFLNGSILGLKQKEIAAKMESIIAFAELEKYIDVAVKRYSTGMYARLGFAVAVHVDPDILLVDEVLSVGDINFQRKCFDFIHSYVTGGNTAVFVSHNLYALEQLCNEIVWLDQGKLVDKGPSREILLAYVKDQDHKLSQISHLNNKESGALNIERAYISNSEDVPKNEFQSGEAISVHIDYYTLTPIYSPYFVLAVWDAATRQALFIASMLIDKNCPDVISGKGHLICRFQPPLLMPRIYQVWGEIYGSDQKNILFPWQPLCAFSVCEDPSNKDGSIRHQRTDAPVRVQYTWDLSKS
jgi:ABC-type polysaccharide/polyol phosphate transport system ATPase subunit